MSGATDIRVTVRERYGALAEQGGGCCGSSGCGCGDSAGPGLAAIGYTAEQAAAIPDGANLGLGCGNPLAHANVRAGETVLDLGSGAGIDAFLAAREVGAGGRVIGVDMTPAMLDRARKNAAEGGYKNVEFRLGEIEHLPVADGTVDLIISNCVVNLSQQKDQVFREAHRALRPGGRMLVSDLVLEAPLPKEIKESVEAYVGCIAGASMKEDYLRLIREAGFEQVEIVRSGSYGDAPVASVQVRAVKPAIR
jgi:SAM-dependent methyltransferase